MDPELISMIPRKYINRHAFSLVELLVVIAIVSIISTLAISSLSGIQRSMAMTSGASQLMDYLATGRQIAMTLNQPVRVWFCTGTTNDTVLLYRTENGVNIAAAQALKLNERLMLSRNATWSSVLTGVPTADPKGDNGYSFRFMPDGSTDLPVGPSPTLTLIERKDANSAKLLNFFTLQIDQQIGTVRTFRP